MKFKRTSLTEYEVQSEHDHLPYAVDLLANGGQGSCTCPDFLARRRPRQKLLGELLPETLSQGSCKHLKAAREDFLISIIKQLLQR